MCLKIWFIFLNFLIALAPNLYVIMVASFGYWSCEENPICFLGLFFSGSICRNKSPNSLSKSLFDRITPSKVLFEIKTIVFSMLVFFGACLFWKLFLLTFCYIFFSFLFLLIFFSPSLSVSIELSKALMLPNYNMRRFPISRRKLDEVYDFFTPFFKPLIRSNSFFMSLKYHF